MGNFRKKISEIRKKYRRQSGLNVLMTMAAFIVFGIAYSMVLPAITLEEETAYEDPGMFLEEEAAAYEEPAYEEEYAEEPAYEEKPAYEKAGAELEYEEPAYEEYAEEPVNEEPANDEASEEWADWADEDSDTYYSGEAEVTAEDAEEAPAYTEFTWEEEDAEGHKLTVTVTPDDEIDYWPADIRLEVTRILEEDEETRDLYEACLEEGKKQEEKDEELELSLFSAWKFAFVTDEDEYVLDAPAKVEAEFAQPVSADENRSGRVLLYRWPGRDMETEDAETDFDYSEDNEIKGFSFHADSLLCDGVIFEVVWPEEETKEEPEEAVFEKLTEEETEEALFEEVAEEETEEELFEEVTEEETEEELFEEVTEEETEEETEEWKAASGLQIVNVEGGDYTLQISYDESAGIPEGAVFTAAVVKDDSYEEEAIEAVNGTVAEDISGNLRVCSLFDLTILWNGKVIEPAGPLEIRVEFTEKVSDEIYAVHFPGTGEQPEAEKTAGEAGTAEALESTETADNTDNAEDVNTIENDANADIIPGNDVEPEVIAAEAEGTIATFTVEGLSYYALVAYTMDFHCKVDGVGFVITVKFDEKEELPEELKLTAEEILWTTVPRQWNWRKRKKYCRPGSLTSPFMREKRNSNRSIRLR